MQLTKIKFGTDGWRGVIADDFTFENVRRVAQATADYWNSMVGTNRAAIVGYDNRFLSEVYAKLVCEVFAANGIKALYPPVAVPTPAVSFAVRDRKLSGAVMITASHNPPQFNGYKLKAYYAGPADPEICAQVEARVDRSVLRTINFDDGLKNGSIEIYDPQPAHEAAVRKIIDLKKIRGAKLRVVADSMYGCGGHLLETLLGKSACQVQTIRGERDALFGGVNPEPIGKNLGALCDAVKKTRAQIGLATDGDADRLGIVDDKGKYVSIQLVFSMLLLHLLRNRGEKTGLVVKSANSTILIDRICRANGLKLAEVPVGFKYICEKMRETDVLIGGEESGGIGFQGHIPERDGIVANLMLLEMLTVTGKRLSEIARDVQKEFGASFYDRIDMHFPMEKRERFIETLRTKAPKEIQGVPVAQMKDFDGVKYICKDDSWLMFRTSGTEPIIRIYSEASTDARMKKLLEHGRGLAVKIAKE
jgi:alpha-D-glucose phosphate-specific phosphoglucomutase